jgi:thioredoxin-related protein
MRVLRIVSLIVALSLLGAAQQSAAPRHQVYDESADAQAQVAAVILKARSDHKRILLVFGGNWCGDCLALDRRFHEPAFQPVLERNFHVLHVDVGRMEKNIELADKYQIPLKKGVPAIAVLDSQGKLLYSQKNGEFSDARRMDPQVLMAFLNRWKPTDR